MTNAIPPNWIKSKLRFHPCLPKVDTRNTWVTGITLNKRAGSKADKMNIAKIMIAGSHIVCAFNKVPKVGTAAISATYSRKANKSNAIHTRATTNKAAVSNKNILKMSLLEAPLHLCTPTDLARIGREDTEFKI